MHARMHTHTHSTHTHTHTNATPFCTYFTHGNWGGCILDRCGQLKWTQHFTMHTNFVFCKWRMKKKTELDMTYLKSDVHVAKVYTHSSQWSHQERSKHTANNWLPFLPFQLVLRRSRWLENVPHLEKKAITSKSTAKFCFLWPPCLSLCKNRNASPVLKNSFVRTCGIYFWIEKCKFEPK